MELWWLSGKSAVRTEPDTVNRTEMPLEVLYKKKIL
jgi:hypothetical protein